MPLTRLDNLISSKTGKYLYVSPDDFNASDALDNRGNSPTRPFVTIQRAFLETARYSYVPGSDNDRFDQFTILLAPGNHYIDNRPGDADASTIPAFAFSGGEWTDTSILDLSNPNNILRKFNSVEGGAIIPRGTSLVGTDLRRTQVRPLYVPDPADKDIGRTSLFQVTGGCYFWQFTILDGDLTPNNPLYDATAGVGKVYSQPDGTVLSIPEYSHHKITNFVFARKEDLGPLYQKVAKAFSNYQTTIDDPGEFAFKIQENRIVGPLSDSVTIEKIEPTNITTGPFSGTCDITVTTKINHGFFTGQYVAITGLNAGQDKLNGVFKVKSISGTNLKEFTYNVPYSAAGLGLTSGATYTESSTVKLSKIGTTASVQAEVDSVESASPYVFNVSIRSTWGICGIWADGSRATGFKSMVIAQYTGVSLQKDDRAFIRYDEFTNTWNQANLQDAFSTTPYHIDGTAYWKDDWRNFHVRASEDAFIQCVSIFAVGFADHFLMESGGDMSITNSNSNFGNTSLHTIGYKGFSFNQDKGGYVTHIIPPKKLIDSTQDIKNYYTINVPLSNDASNNTKLYYGIDNASDPTDRPAASIQGYKLGAKAGEKLYVKLDAVTGESGKQIKTAIVVPNGVKKWTASLSTLSPTGLFTADENKNQDAANLIDANKTFIQAEAFGYILQKYPALQNISYVNPNINSDTGRYRDASNLIKANRTEIIERAFLEIAVQYNESLWGNNWVVPGDSTNQQVNRYWDAYRLIQKNRNIIVETAYATVVASPPSPAPTNMLAKCKRDIGYFVDAISMDIGSSGGNRYTRKFVQQYFSGNTTLLTNGLAGEVTQSITAFDKARDAIKAAITNTLASFSGVVTSSPAGGTWVDGSTGSQTVYTDLTITAGTSTYGGGGATIANNNATACADVRSAVDTLATIVSTTLTAVDLSTLPVESTGTADGAGESKCKRDIGYIVDAVVSDLYNGGNAGIIDATKAYFTSAGAPISPGLIGEETQSVIAFNKARDWMKKALTNQLYVKDTTLIDDPSTGSNLSENSCANVRATVDSLTSIITSAVSSGNISSLPPRDPGAWSSVGETSKCKRDIGYIVEAVTSDLRLGGNVNIVNAAESYYVGTTLDYINNEKTETLDAYNYVRDLCIAAMRNWSFTIQNATIVNGSPTVTVASTIGLVMGMTVTGTGIPVGAYVKRVINATSFELGTSDSFLNLGATVNATASSTTVTLTFNLTGGIWADTSNIQPVTDSSVIVDTNYPECANVATTITTQFQTISTIINNGVGTVPVSSPTLDTASLATRATLFKLTEITTSNTNPHNLETGTPVRLVPKALNDSVDKRLVRLPKGFDTNTKYYVIAPGRNTEPFDFSSYTTFNGATSTQQALMLATSEENANAGIYIYSPETEAIDLNVVIEVHQYVQDMDYDLYQYKANIVNGSNEVFETEGPHSFDKQASNTTPQKVFFRTGVDISSSTLPTRSTPSGGGTLPTNIEYYVRYVPPVTTTEARNTKFTIHTSHIDAINGTNAVQFSAAGTKFYVFCNKRRTPVRFDAEASIQDVDGNKGSWYIQTLSTDNTILERLKTSVYADTTGKTRTTDTWFYRVNDDRTSSDRAYRIRYVIPKEGNYRDPINGFVLKIRTDETRRLLPQKIVLKPVGAANSFANVVKNGERLGLTTTEQKTGSAYNTANPNFISQYDPYKDPYVGETDNKISFSVQSAKKINVDGSNYLQLTVFDVGIIDQALKTSLFTSVKVSTPQGGTGNFIANSAVTWSGANTGSATVHAWFPSHNYLILKNVTGSLDYSAFADTTFTQGSVTAVMQEEKDGGRSNKKNYLYTVDGVNVYTLTPGDTITLPSTSGGNAQYRIDSVQDVDDLANTYYVFKSETIRRRIKGQQDGIYYLTAIRGDIRPYPVGSGIGENFRNFKFSQPVSRIYPLNQKNDPLWFQVTDSVTNQDNPSRDTTLLDPPATVSSADNYIHGYVTVNDAKRSVTKEAILDLVADPGTGSHIFTGDNAITAKEGGASAGSESRKIPVSGESDFPTEQRLYVELRRPSIARSGNHTFEYLGFGPGNYSTGFPARQQVILTDKQDFYAQAKKEDAGLVLYTGLNSSGDLYIGNRKINAITGEETFLDAPITEEENEDVGITNVLVTTFDDPVTFNNTVAFNYNQVIPANLPIVAYNVPISISSDTTNSAGAVIKPPLTIINYSSPSGTDANDPKQNGNGDMTLGNNIFAFGVWDMNVRGSQDYRWRTATNNYTPVQVSSYGSDSSRGAAGFFNTSQQITTANSSWGSNPPKSGEILLKGSKVTYSGSMGWIYANDYEEKTTTGGTPQVISVKSYATYSIIRVEFGDTLSNLNIRQDSQIRITNSSNSSINSPTAWSIPTTNVIISADANGGVAINEPAYPGASATYLYLSISPNVGTTTVIQNASALGLKFYVSNNLWKEWGVIGSESIRTKTSTFGDYKVGINTLARSTDTAYQEAYITTETEPRANLDIVGNTFISGKSTAVSINSSGVSTKTSSNLDNAFLVGGDSETPANTATLRVATTNSGRVGINIANSSLDRTLVVSGNGRITGDFRFESDIEVNGGDLTSTSSTFNLLNNSSSPTTVLNLAGYATTANLFNTTTSSQSINVGTASTSTTSFNLHTASTNSTINVGTVGNANNTYQSLITLGGAFANPSASIFRSKTYQNILDGNLQINGGENVVDGGYVKTRATINSSANILNMFTESGAVTTLNIGTYATAVTLGGLAGTTTIQNNLVVKAASQSFSSLTMNGGYLSASASVTRGQLGTTASVHQTGSGSSLNIDYYRFISDIDGSQNITSVSGNTFNVVSSTQYFQNNQLICFPVVTGLTGITQSSFDVYGDPTGPYYYVINATANSFQVSLTNGGPAVTIGGTFVQATATLRYTTVYSDGFSSWNATSTTLPLNNGKGIGPNEYLLIDNEIVKTTNFPTSTSPFTVTVTRGVDGTTAASHGSDTQIFKLQKTPTASYITPNWIPASTITKTGTGQISVNTSTNQLTTTGTDLNNTYIIQFTNVGGLTGVNTSTKYFVVNITTGASTQTFQISPTYPNLTAVDIEGSVTAATSFTVDSTNINLAEFGGSFVPRDYLRIDGTNVSGSGVSEYVKIISTPTGDTKKFSINNGAPTPTVVFSVDSITGDTSIAGNLTLGKNLTVNGSTIANTDLFTITDGAPTPITRFQVDSSSGNTVIGGSTSGGSLTIGDDFTIKNGISGGTTYFSVDAQTGNTVIGSGNSGTLKIESNASSTNTSSGALVVDGGVGIGENLNVAGDITLGGGDLTVNDGSTKRFKVNNTGVIDLGGIDSYFTSSGGRKWVFINTDSNTEATIGASEQLVSNVNYLVKPSGAPANLILKLPTSPQTGDMIRIVDVGGNIKYNCQLVIRAPSGVKIQGDDTGTNIGLTSGTYSGGELIINTPNAAFGLIYSGTVDGSGNGIPSSYRGWWLMEI